MCCFLGIPSTVAVLRCVYLHFSFANWPKHNLSTPCPPAPNVCLVPHAFRVWFIYVNHKGKQYRKSFPFCCSKKVKSFTEALSLSHTQWISQVYWYICYDIPTELHFIRCGKGNVSGETKWPNYFSLPPLFYGNIIPCFLQVKQKLSAGWSWFVPSEVWYMPSFAFFGSIVNLPTYSLTLFAASWSKIPFTYEKGMAFGA